MTQELVFATHNLHKLEEVAQLLGNNIKLLSLDDIGCHDDIPEEMDTLEGNALQKAQYIYNKFQYNCFADDTGLEVQALDGKPGVYSARYSEDEAPELSAKERSEANINKLLFQMKNIKNRKATFRTIICLVRKTEILFFEGIIDGKISYEKRGNLGFGYDPVFIPDQYNKTFAEINLKEKNKVSHRANAITKLVNYLNS